MKHLWISLLSFAAAQAQPLTVDSLATPARAPDSTVAYDAAGDSIVTDSTQVVYDTVYADSDGVAGSNSSGTAISLNAVPPPPLPKPDAYSSSSSNDGAGFRIFMNVVGGIFSLFDNHCDRGVSSDRSDRGSDHGSDRGRNLFDNSSRPSRERGKQH